MKPPTWTPIVDTRSNNKSWYFREINELTLSVFPSRTHFRRQDSWQYVVYQRGSQVLFGSGYKNARSARQVASQRALRLLKEESKNE